MLLLLLLVVVLSSAHACPLSTVDIHSGCYCGIEIDGTNYIHCQAYSIDAVPKFSRSYLYDKLNLTKNFIRNLTNQSFEQLKVKRIYLQENPIESIDKFAFDQTLLNNLEELYIDSRNGSSIEFLCYGLWRKLRVLQLTGFNLNSFQSCFSKFHRLEKLIVTASHIDHLSFHIYTLPVLSQLSLVNNQMAALNFDDDPTKSSPSIRVLNLTSNQLQSIPLDLARRMPYLTTLDLSDNLISNLSLTDHMSSWNVNLSSNALRHFHFDHKTRSTDLSANPICTLERSVELADVVLHSLSQLHCDCRLSFFLERNLTNPSQPIELRSPWIKELVCATPTSLQGHWLKDLTYEQLLQTCSVTLPDKCVDVRNFPQIHQYAQQLTENKQRENETPNKDAIIDRREQSPSFRLTSFFTIYERNDLLVVWDFESDYPVGQLQITVEQDFSSRTEVVRRSDSLSPSLKQYTIQHLPSNRHYQVCLLFTRVAHGTDKYCRETSVSTKQTLSNLLSLNRSIILGFLAGTMLTACLLFTLAFVCHLQDQRKPRRTMKSSLSHHPRYMYIDRNDDDGTYSHSIVSFPSSKYQHLRKPPHGTFTLPMQSSPISRSPCCFLHYHHTPPTTLSSTTTTATQRINSLSLDCSHGLEVEPMTSMSMVSNATLDERPLNRLHCSTKHVYEELGDETTMTNFLL